MQTPGSLMKYDAVLDKYIDIQSDLLLNIQKLKGNKWLIHVTDPSNKFSYSRHEFTPDSQIEL